MLYGKQHTIHAHVAQTQFEPIDLNAIADSDIDARRIFARSGIDFSNVPTSQRQRIAIRLRGLMQQFRHPN